jgi:hypothetical protein
MIVDWLVPFGKQVPFGKHTNNISNSHCFMCKSTISMVIFNSYFKLPEGRLSKPSHEGEKSRRLIDELFRFSPAAVMDYELSQMNGKPINQIV